MCNTLGHPAACEITKYQHKHLDIDLFFLFAIHLPMIFCCRPLGRSYVCLAVSAELDGVESVPDSHAGWPGLGGLVSLGSETAVLLASAGKTTGFSVLVNGVHNPVDAWVLADGGGGGINHNDLKVLEDGILANPVRVQDSQTTQLLSGAGFSDGLQAALVLQLVHTSRSGLTVANTLAHWAMATTTADTNAEHNESSLPLVSQLAGLLWALWVGNADNFALVAEFPGAHTLLEPQSIALLLLPKQGHVCVCTHADML